MKQSVIISNKHGIFKFPQDLSNDLRYLRLRDFRKLGNIKKIPKLHGIILVRSPPPKMKILSILAKNSGK